MLTNATWNPVTGCKKVSQGGKDCCAEIERMGRRVACEIVPKNQETTVNKKVETPVNYDSPEAASIQTVTGWVSRSGRFWGNDEHMARFDGCTHRKCEMCEALLPARGYHLCDQCREANEIEKYQAMPRRPWSGGPVPIQPR